MQLLEFNKGKISPLKGLFRKQKKQTILKCLDFQNPSVITLNTKSMPTLNPGKNPKMMVLSDAHVYIKEQTLRAVQDEADNSKVILLGFFIEIDKDQEITPQVTRNNHFIPERTYQIKVMPSTKSSTGYGVWGFTLLHPGDTFNCEGVTTQETMWSVTNLNGFAKVQNQN
jgi:hypothetical protein